MSYEHIDVRKVGANLGAVVDGVRLGSDIEPAVVALVTLYIMATLLLVGLVCNLLVLPLGRDRFMPFGRPGRPLLENGERT